MRIASYNLLADAYIRPEHYPRCDPTDFRASDRHPRLEKRIVALDADILLLQEVEHAVYVRLDRQLRPLGYVGRWAHKTAGKPDGCATFVRAPLRVAGWTIHELEDGGDKPAGHAALTATIVRDGRTWTIVNTHLKWHPADAPPKERVGLIQGRHLLTVLAKPPRTVIGGDFNAEPGSEVLGAFLGPGFIDAHPASASTFILKGRPQKIDHLLHTPDLKAVPHPPAALAPDSALPSASEPSDHLPLLADFFPV